MPRQVLGVGHPNLIIEALRDNQEKGKYRFASNPKKAYGKAEWNSIQCWLRIGEVEAECQLQQMPGCCAVLVLSYIRTKPYSQENVDQVIQIVEQAANDAGFGSVVMTQVVPKFSRMFWNYEPWIKCLSRGWVASAAFRNAKSGNLVTYLTKDMKQPAKREGLEVPIYEEQN